MNLKKSGHTFEDIIWRVYPDEIQNKLIIETRNNENRLTNFYCYDIITHHIEIINLEISEKWWLGIEDVHDGNIYFHYYNAVEFSNHRSILCYNFNLNQIVWQHPNLEFHKLTKDVVIAIKQSKTAKLYLKLNIQNGEVLESMNSIEMQKNDIDALLKLKNECIFSPTIFAKLDADFDLVSLFIQKKLGVVAEHSLEYLEFGNYIIISFYIFDREMLVNKLLVISLEGNIVLEEVLMDAQKGAGVGTFFVCNGKLIFVKLKYELFVYEL